MKKYFENNRIEIKQYRDSSEKDLSKNKIKNKIKANPSLNYQIKMKKNYMKANKS
jgi:hypothetical protein